LDKRKGKLRYVMIPCARASVGSSHSRDDQSFRLGDIVRKAGLAGSE
jgi:hypothetical protein